MAICLHKIQIYVLIRLFPLMLYNLKVKANTPLVYVIILNQYLEQLSNDYNVLKFEYVTLI